MPSKDDMVGTPASPAEEAAARAFLRQRRLIDESGRRMPDEKLSQETDPVLKDVDSVWNNLRDCASTPEFIELREQSLARFRKAKYSSPIAFAQSRRWTRELIAAAMVIVILAVGFAWSSFSPEAPEITYQTAVGEQRLIELEDRSRIALDSMTTVVVKYSPQARVILLTEGQAQFFVEKDSTRPFKVEAGGHSVVAVGTVFNVEYVSRQMRVSMMEGRVAVTLRTAVNSSKENGAGPASGNVRVAELTAGQSLLVQANGNANLDRSSDVDAAIAWRQGKIIFHEEPLERAVEKLNRYSRLRLVIEDKALLKLNVNGVFAVGDSEAVVDALKAYAPIAVDYSEPGMLRLTSIQ